MLKRLRIKFICINMLIATAMLCVIFGMVFHFTRQNLESESLRTLRSLAAEPLRPGEVRLPCFTLELGRGGRLTVAGGAYYDLSDEEFLRKLLKAALETGEQTGILAEYDLRFQRTVAPAGQRVVFVDMSSERSALSSLVKTCAVTGAASLLAFFLISLFLARWAVKPVERAWTEQRQFVADASHELKTPLTVILTNAERFYRTDKVRSMNRSYGLGLSIAEGIVREHHGRIWAESKDGRNTFFVELPI